MARQRTAPAGPEVLGEVITSSGIVVLLDFGLLDLWCHDSPPLMPEWAYDEKTVEAANGGADFRIVGPDAVAAGRAFDRQANPRYLFDVPAQGVESIQQQFSEFTAQHGFKARLSRQKRRIPHRKRIDLALTEGEPSGEIFFFGVWGRVIGGLPRRKTMRVLGERLPQDHRYAGRWRWVWLECRPDATVARTVEAGTVAVDRARLGFFDADALGAWQHQQPLDGLADFVFWGRDASAMAQEVDAPALPEEQFGWLDSPVVELAQRALHVEELKQQRGWMLGTDFRPHSHHYHLMAQIRDGVTESGTLLVGGAKMCGFLTSWGDGFYPVLLDLDAAGQPVRVRIDLGGEQTVDRQDRLEERYSGAFALACVVEQRVLSGESRVGYLYRTQPAQQGDSGWRIFASTEQAPALTVVPIRAVLDAQRDPAMEAVLRGPIGSVFVRQQPDEPFVAQQGFDPNRGE